MLPSRLKYGLAATAALCSCSAYAAGFLQLYSEARESDPRYVAAKADVDFAQSLVVQSRGQLLPQIGITGSQIKNDTDNEQRTILGTVNREYSFTSKNASLNLSQALFRPQAWVGYGQSKAQVLVSEEQLRQARQDLILRLAQAYFDVLLAEVNVSLAREQKGAIAEELKRALRQFEAGVGTVTDINEAQARHDLIAAQEVTAKNTLEAKIHALAIIVGKVYRDIKQFKERPPLEKPEPADVEHWVDFALNNNPALQAKTGLVQVADLEVRKTFSGHLPTVDLVAGRSYAQDPSFTNLNSTAWSNTVGIQVGIPIFSGGTTQGRVNQAQASRDRATQELEQVRRDVVQGTRQEYLNVVSGLVQVPAYEQAVKSNEIALYSAKKGQEAGLRTSFDVLNAQQLVFGARRDQAQAIYNYLLARLKLRAAAGLLGDDDVAQMEQWLSR